MGFNNHIFAKNKKDNKIYCWGWNILGQLGLKDNNYKETNVEFKIEGNLSPIKQIICGWNFTFAICENNKIYCWGYNS